MLSAGYCYQKESQIDHNKRLQLYNLSGLQDLLRRFVGKRKRYPCREPSPDIQLMSSLLDVSLAKSREIQQK
jgi:hypothetical protein